jgi:type IV secretion system protein VirD4
VNDSRHEGPIETALLAALALVLIIGLLVAGLAALAATMFGAGWTWTPAAVLPDVLSALPRHAGDPRQAWPEPLQDRMPGAIGFYGTMLGVAAAVAPAGVLVVRRRRNSGAATPATWARSVDLKPLIVRRPEPGRITLGSTGHRFLAAEARQSVIAVAPTQSGKTTGLAIPAILEWDGPVIATSVKTDLIRQTMASRARRGRVQIFDPCGTTQLENVCSWTPLAGCDTWQGARRVAGWLAETAGPTKRGLSDGDFWFATAAKLLAPLLFAAATSKRTIGDVVRWLDTQEEDEIHAALRRAGCDQAMDAMNATWNRDERQRSSIYTTAETLLEAYGDPGVLAHSRKAEISAAQLLNGRANTLYLSASVREQRRLRPVFVTLIQEIVEEAYARASVTGAPLRPGLLLVLDEAANIAPLPDLDVLAATGAGQGVQLLTIFQDLAQAQDRWGRERADTIVNNHRAKIIGAGVSDARTLETVGRLLGDQQVPQESSTAGDGRASTTRSTSWRALAPPNVLRESEVGSAVLIYGTLPPARIRLRPWFASRRLRALAASD